MQLMTSMCGRPVASLVVLLFITLPVCAQNDDYPDYRSKRELFTRIVEKDIRADVATFSMGGIEESVGKPKLKTIPFTDKGPNFISFEGEGIQVTIRSADFLADKHKLTYYNDDYLVKIDNRPYFGDYGKIPKTTVSAVTIIAGRDTINAPAEALADLHNPSFTYRDGGVEKTNSGVFFSADGKTIYVYMLKRERGGSYEVTWVFRDKKYLRRVVDFGFLR